MYKVDLHTHSTASDDGGISDNQYRQLLDQDVLDYIAITDHNTIELAKELHKELGDRIIVGEEIMTTKGELVGLFLKDPIPAGLSPIETARAIHDQDGLVYLPHPFETVRHGLQVTDLAIIAQHIDIVEVHNGRAVFQDRSDQALAWAEKQQTAMAASSDAHGYKGVGHTYSLISDKPERTGLPNSLKKGRQVIARPPLTSLAYPKWHRLRRKLGHSK